MNAQMPTSPVSAWQARLFAFAIDELVRQHRASFQPLWSAESWAKLLIWLALNCGCSGEREALEEFAAALGSLQTTRLRQLFFSRELEELGLRLLADPAEAEALALAEDLVGLGHALPLFLALAVAQVLVDPGDQRTAQRHAEVGGLLGRQATASCAAFNPRAPVGAACGVEV
jgi:hypothetical protein